MKKIIGLFMLVFTLGFSVPLLGSANSSSDFD